MTRKPTTMIFYQDAVDNWPEDEARLEAAYVQFLIEDGEDNAYIGSLVGRIAVKWHAEFSKEQDGHTLYSRFVVVFNSLMPAQYHIG